VEAVEAAVHKVLSDNRLRMEAVAGAASIDVKADEEGLLECCRRYGWPLAFYSARQLNAVAGSFSASEFVRNTVGVDNVCERAAAAGGNLIVGKTALNGVTVAVAEMKWGIEFG
jgi:cobalamin biosynthesis protein CbiG